MSSPLSVYQFDDKYASDTDGFTFNLSGWLGPTDTLKGTPTVTITPSTGVTITTVTVQGPSVTVWVSGGIAGTPYTIELDVLTMDGRNCRIRGQFGVDV